MCIFATTKGVGFTGTKRASILLSHAGFFVRQERLENDRESILSLGGDAHDVAVVNLDVDGAFQ